LLNLFRLLFLPRVALVAENLFLRKQLALFAERKVRSRTTASARIVMLALAKCFDWREALIIVKPETLLKWHRSAFRSFWKWRSRRAGRLPLPKNLRDLIRRISAENPAWGDARIANELLLKLGIGVSPRTVAKYLKARPPRGGDPSQRWATFVRNHAKAIVACDFLVSVTASFRIVYVLVVMEIGSRRILHTNVTAHPTAEWSMQQIRECLPFDHGYRFLIHDRDSIFSESLDQAVRDCGLRVLKTPVRSPKANSYCERLIGTIRRECLDYIIPLNERRLKRTLAEFAVHYNRGRPHSSLGPGIPEPIQASVPISFHQHNLPAGYRVTSMPILGGLHHEYGLKREAP
jgi:putative transposase